MLRAFTEKRLVTLFIIRCIAMGLPNDDCKSKRPD